MKMMVMRTAIAVSHQWLTLQNGHSNLTSIRSFDPAFPPVREGRGKVHLCPFCKFRGKGSGAEVTCAR